MKKSLFGLIATAMCALLLLAAPAASAGEGVDWFINIGAPVSNYSSYGQPTYIVPPPAHYQSRPVYVQPAPVYYPSYPSYPSYSAYPVVVAPHESGQYTNHARPHHWENGRHGRGGHGNGYGHEYREHRGHGGHRGHHGHYQHDR